MPLSLKKNKQSGFTLIELMVVMAIIAILATAGLSAYTGYIKKARDTTRIADINAINKIVLANMSASGMPPQTTLAVYSAVVAANNGIVLMDPLSSNSWTTTKFVCLWPTTLDTWRECSYTYRICDAGLGYAIGTHFESTSNIPLYLEDNIAWNYAHWPSKSIFEIGSCQTGCPWGTSSGCPINTWVDIVPTKIDINGVSAIPWILE